MILISLLAPLAKMTVLNLDPLISIYMSFGKVFLRTISRMVSRKRITRKREKLRERDAKEEKQGVIGVALDDSLPNVVVGWEGHHFERYTFIT